MIEQTGNMEKIILIKKTVYRMFQKFYLCD